MLTTTQTSKLLVSLAEAKRHLGLSDNDHDTDVETLIRAANNYLVRRTSRTLIDTTYALKLHADEWCPGDRSALELPNGPVRSITTAKYYDVDGVDTDLLYQLATDDFRAELWPTIGASWPSVQAERVDAVRITYAAGPAAEPLPEAKRAALLLVRHWYDNPSAVVTGAVATKIEFAVDSLCRSLGVGRYAHV